MLSSLITRPLARVVPSLRRCAFPTSGCRATSSCSYKQHSHVCRPVLLPGRSIFTSSSRGSDDDDEGMSFNTLTFVSDIEGNYDYWSRFVASSLAFDNSHNTSSSNSSSSSGNSSHKLKLKDGYGLVYVGDVCDHGDGDLRLLKDLIHLKDSYKDRVFFVLGNRDVNKLRLLTELDDLTIKDEINAGVFYKDVHNQEKPWTCKSEKLKWMLASNMGSADSFEKRRSELRMILDKESISDEEVMQSYIDLVDPKWFVSKFSNEFYFDSDEVNDLYPQKMLLPSTSSKAATRFQLEYGGLLLKYIKQASLCLQIGDVIILHGGLNDHNIGWIPPQRPEYVVWKSSPHHTFTSTGHLLEIFSKKTSSYVFDVSKLDQSSALGLYEEDYLADRLSEWIYQLEEFKNFEVEDYIRHSRDYIAFYNKDRNDKFNSSQQQQQQSRLPKANYWSGIGGYLHYQPGSRLIQYAMGNFPPALLALSATHSSPTIAITASTSISSTVSTVNDDIVRNNGIIYSNFLSAGMVSYIKDKTFHFLEKCGIRRILVGHQPLGDSPLIINNKDSIQVVCLDTSHSAAVKWRSIAYANSNINFNSKYDNSSSSSSEAKCSGAGDGDNNKDSISEDDDRRERLLGLDHTKLQTDTNTSLPFTDNYSYKAVPFDQANSILMNIRESYKTLGQETMRVTGTEKAYRDVRLGDTRGMSAGHVDIEFIEDREINEIKSRNMKCYGSLSNGHKYYFEMPVYSSSSSSSSSSNSSTSQLIGKRTKGGWVMRANGVTPILTSSESSPVSRREEEEGGGAQGGGRKQNQYVMLSYVKGYDVYNRYILQSDVKYLDWV